MVFQLHKWRVVIVIPVLIWTVTFFNGFMFFYFRDAQKEHVQAGILFLLTLAFSVYKTRWLAQRDKWLYWGWLIRRGRILVQGATVRTNYTRLGKGATWHIELDHQESVLPQQRIRFLKYFSGPWFLYKTARLLADFFKLSLDTAATDPVVPRAYGGNQ